MPAKDGVIDHENECVGWAGRWIASFAGCCVPTPTKQKQRGQQELLFYWHERGRGRNELLASVWKEVAQKELLICLPSLACLLEHGHA